MAGNDNTQSAKADLAMPPPYPVLEQPALAPQQVFQQPQSLPRQNITIQVVTGPGSNQPVSSSPQRPPLAGDFRFHLEGVSSFHIRRRCQLLDGSEDAKDRFMFLVKDQLGTVLYNVTENRSWIVGKLSPSSGPFVLILKDLSGFKGLILEHQNDCCGCGKRVVNVTTPVGEQLGAIRLNNNFSRISLTIKDQAGEEILRVKGPHGLLVWREKPKFKLLARGCQIGEIRGDDWSGPERRHLSDTKYLSMSMPVSLEPSTKALALACLFLINYRFFGY